MTKLSMNKAAKVAHKTKQTIKDDLDSGKLSGTKNARGHWEIEESELFRVYDLKTSDLVSDQSPKPDDTAQNDQQFNALQAILDAKEQVEAELRNQIEDLKIQRDKWQTQAERQTLLLEKSATEAAEASHRGLFSFLRGRG